MTKRQVGTLSQGICVYRPLVDSVSSLRPSGKLFRPHGQCGVTSRTLADSQSPETWLWEPGRIVKLWPALFSKKEIMVIAWCMMIVYL